MPWRSGGQRADGLPQGTIIHACGAEYNDEGSEATLPPTGHDAETYEIEHPEFRLMLEDFRLNQRHRMLD